jgi:hypothetical protein
MWIATPVEGWINFNEGVFLLFLTWARLASLAHASNYGGKFLFPAIRNLSTNVVHLNKGPIYVNLPIAIYPSNSIVVYQLQHY